MPQATITKLARRKHITRCVMKIQDVVIPVFSFCLVACGSGQSGSSGDSVGGPSNPVQNEAALSLASSPDELEEVIKNGLRSNTQSQFFGPEIAVDVVAEAAPVADSSSDDSNNFSATTVQVEGVQEADRIKYDGEHLYVLNSSFVENFFEPAPVEPSVDTDEFVLDSFLVPVSFEYENTLSIYQTDPASADFSLVSDYEISETDSSISTMYQLQIDDVDYVVTIADTVFLGWFYTLLTDEDSWLGGKTTINMLDVSDPSNVNESWQLEIEGVFQESRRIGNMLYVVSRYIPTVQGLHRYASNDEQVEQNERLIADAELEDLLPVFQENDQPQQPLLTGNECYVGPTTEDQGYADLLVVTAIDLQQQKITSASCVNSYISGVYSSLDSLYIGTNMYGSFNGVDFEESTTVHKFSYDESDVNYRASGSVEGTIGWQNPGFYMDEKQDNLRIVTTTRDFSAIDPVDRIKHTLTVLADDGEGALTPISQLPNEQRPEAIGKPGEDIFAVRFFGDRVYIVTFERIDPLYVIDLADEENPFIAGELEIPGFATFLQPLNDDYLFSVGNNADEETGFINGVKIELFDVSDPTTPQTVDKFVVGEFFGAFSEALNDYHAITFLNLDEDHTRVALPIQPFSNGTGGIPVRFPYSLHTWDIEGLSTANASMTFNGALDDTVVEGNNVYLPSRSVLHNDAVFYVSQSGGVSSGLWEELSNP